MPDLPDTRVSLVARLKDPADSGAWSEFLELYHPAVYRLARRRGLQPADAEDLAQRVFVSVSQAIERWDPDPRRGQFRAWLMTITRNAILNTLTRVRPDQATGGTSALQLLEVRYWEEADWGAELEGEYRRQVFRRAMQQLRRQVQPDTWEAFWLTSVQGEKVEQVAARLGKTAGAVYASRCRLMRRLKEIVRQYQWLDES